MSKAFDLVVPKHYTRD